MSIAIRISKNFGYLVAELIIVLMGFAGAACMVVLHPVRFIQLLIKKG